MTDPFIEDTQPAPGLTGVGAHRVSLVLDAVAVLAVAAGVAWGLWRWLGPFSLAVGGVVVGVLVHLSEEVRKPRPLRQPGRRAGSGPPPGPTHPGTLHVSGG
jgi:hypothetical protein